MIGSLRATSAVSELSATYFAPKIMSRIGAIRAGIWFLSKYCCSYLLPAAHVCNSVRDLQLKPH